jgi:sigma-E factor negative regulatory protein RseA
MNNLTSVSGEQLSDAMDGRLQGESGRVFDALLSDAQAVQTWHVHHVIGDVLRSEELAPSARDLAFWERLERKLADEPVRPSVPVVMDVSVRSASAANASVLRWKWLAGVACAVLVSVVGSGAWNQFTGNTDAQLASSAPATKDVSSQVALVPQAPVMIRDPELDALMAAHHQLGGHSALQMPSGFLRNATFERPAQ